MKEVKEEPQAETQAMQYAKQNKQDIMKQFCPTFTFSAGEYIYPTSAEKYAEDVLTAKKRHYEGKLQGGNLSTQEIDQYNLIKEHFFPNKAFDIKGFEKPEVEKYLENDLGHGTASVLLMFNEKELGYPLGSQVPIGGNKPGADKQVKAPIYTSYVPTEDGAIIRYECFYPLSGAIYGTNWLYKLLPEKFAKKLGNLAVHAGDWEGVYIKVKIDENGNAQLDHMQTFAHGTKGAVKVEPRDIDFTETGSPRAYVATSTHATYSNKFPVNTLADNTGAAYSLKPENAEFVDLSPEVKKPAWAKVVQWGPPVIMTAKDDYVKSGAEYDEKQKGWLEKNYRPLNLAVLYRKAKQFIINLIEKIVPKKLIPEKLISAQKPLVLKLKPLDAPAPAVPAPVVPAQATPAPAVPAPVVPAQAASAPAESHVGKLEEQRRRSSVTSPSKGQ